MSGRVRWGCLLAILYPVVEVSLAVYVASLIGWWWVLVYVVACVTLGLGLVRYALSASGRSFGVAIATLRMSPGEQAVMIEGSTPARPSAPPAQTLLIVPAGLLIAIPGFMTTLAGLVLWLPPLRALIARRVQARIDVYRPDSGDWPTSG